MADFWSILCPGPSLRSATLPSEEHAIIAVNLAPLSKLPCNFWAVQDSLHRMQEVIESTIFKNKKPVVLCREQEAGKWQELGFPVWPHPNTDRAFAKFFPILKNYDPTICYAGLSFTMAVVRAAAFGAKQIYVYGCDMAGYSYSYGKDWANRPKEYWDERWAWEGKAVDRFLADIKSRGVSITLVKGTNDGEEELSENWR